MAITKDMSILEVVQQYPDSDWATEAQRALEDVVWLEKHASELPRRKR